MIKSKKTFPVLLVLTLVLALVAMAISAVQFDREKDKELRALQAETIKADRAALTSAVQIEEQTDIMAKGEAGVAFRLDRPSRALLSATAPPKDEGESHPEDPAYELGLTKASRPAVQEDLKVNPFKTQPTMPAYTPRTEILWEGFEGGVVPPTDWTAIVNNPYTWEIDSYNPYEGTYNASCFYDPALGTQDEWLVSSEIDLTGKTDWKLEFVWMSSYYWGVDPYDNYDLVVQITDVDGAT